MKRSDDGNFEIGPGFGPSRNVTFAGNLYVGKHVDRPEDAGAKTEGKIPKRQWDSPRYDPAKGGDFDKFLKAHRAWLRKLMQQEFPGVAIP